METAESLQFRPETISRRTDSLLYNAYHLHSHMIDRNRGLFDPTAEADVLEQNLTETAESDIHNFGPSVYQVLDESKGQYVSLGRGTVSNNLIGLRSLDFDDALTGFEFDFRIEDVVEEDVILRADVQEGMRRGGVKVNILPAPTHHEADPDIAESLGYDDRTMLRIQKLSPDGRVKEMTSFSVFNVPAHIWAKFLGNQYGTGINPTSLAVRRFCHGIPLEFGSTDDVLDQFIGGVLEYLSETDRESVEAQLDAFKTEQAELAKQAQRYAQEKLEVQKELARSLNDWATDPILKMVRIAMPNLDPKHKIELSKRFVNQKLHVDDYVAELVVKLKAVTTHNRAGLAALNERTVKRATYKMGIEAVVELIERERAIQASPQGMDEFMISLTERQIAGAGLECGGGCSVSVVDLYSKDGKEAAEAGLSGTLYSSTELDKNSKCQCSNKKKAKVISDGKNVVCTKCGDYQVKSRRGNLKDSIPKAA